MIQVGYYRIDMLAMVYHDSLIHCTTQNIKQNFFYLFILFSFFFQLYVLMYGAHEMIQRRTLYVYKSQTHMALDITIIQSCQHKP